MASPPPPATSPHLQINPATKSSFSGSSHADNPDGSSYEGSYQFIDQPSPRTPTENFSYSYSPQPENKENGANNTHTQHNNKNKNHNATKYNDKYNDKIKNTVSNSISSYNGYSGHNGYRKDSGNPHKTKTNHHLDTSGQFPYFEESQDDKKQQHVIKPYSPKHGTHLSNNYSNQYSNHYTEKQKEKDKKEEFEKKDLSKEEIKKLEKETLSKYGYIRTKFIAATLQGEVFQARLVKKNKEMKQDEDAKGNHHHDEEEEDKKVVVKKTSKKLHKLGITITKSGKKIKVQENIVAEAQLMQNFWNNSPPSSLIEYYDFFQDSHYFYLVMEDGGSDFFDFIVKCHELISGGKLSLGEWRKHVKFMFAQMVQFIRWMHETMHCANLDISLENMLIRDCAYFDEESKTLKKCYVKFIDFGLTEFFDLNTNPTFLCKKYVGKTHYKAPKVYGKKEIFSANKADIWSLGVCLFMMIIGAPPYNKPIDKDITFQYIKYKQIAKLLNEWNRIKYVTSNLHDLLTKMLTFDENKRITMDEIVRHPWIKHYFPNENKPKPPPNPPKVSISNSADNVYLGNHIRPTSPSGSASRNDSHSISKSMQSQSNIKGHGAATAGLNVMIPQQGANSVSGSVFSPSVSRSATGSFNIDVHAGSVPRKYSNPYTPYSQYSPYPVPISPQSGDGTRPRPIIQSQTSEQYKGLYQATVDNEHSLKYGYGQYSNPQQQKQKNIKFNDNKKSSQQQQQNKKRQNSKHEKSKSTSKNGKTSKRSSFRKNKRSSFKKNKDKKNEEKENEQKGNKENTKVKKKKSNKWWRFIGGGN